MVLKARMWDWSLSAGRPAQAAYTKVTQTARTGQDVGGPVHAAVGVAQGTPTGCTRRALTRPSQRDAGFRRDQGEGERPAVNRYVLRNLTPPVVSDPQRPG